MNIAFIPIKMVLPIFMLLSMRTTLGSDFGGAFNRIPASSQWGMSIHMTGLFDFLPADKSQQRQLESRLRDARRSIEKISGIDINGRAINQMIFFGTTNNPQKPQGVIVKGQVKFEQFLSNYRRRLLESTQLSMADLPIPRSNKQGFKEFRFKNEMALAEISKGVLAISKSPLDIESISASYKTSENSVKFLQSFPSDEEENETIPLFNFFVNDLGEFYKNQSTLPIIEKAEGILISIRHVTELDQLRIYLSLSCKDVEAAELMVKSAEGFQALAKLTMLSSTAQKKEESLGINPQISEIAKALIETLKIKQNKNSVVLAISVGNKTTNKIRNSLFEAMNDKFGNKR